MFFFSLHHCENIPLNNNNNNKTKKKEKEKRKNKTEGGGGEEGENKMKVKMIMVEKKRVLRGHQSSVYIADVVMRITLLFLLCMCTLLLSPAEGNVASKTRNSSSSSSSIGSGNSSSISDTGSSGSSISGNSGSFRTSDSGDSNRLSVSGGSISDSGTSTSGSGNSGSFRMSGASNRISVSGGIISDSGINSSNSSGNSGSFRFGDSGTSNSSSISDSGTSNSSGNSGNFRISDSSASNSSSVSGGSGNRSRSRIRIRHAHALLKKLNKAPLKSIQSPDGDIIDCVLKEKQPAFDHPLLKHHQIQEPPMILQLSENSNREQRNTVGQSWQQIGNCPLGTVPIRRTSLNDLLRSGKSPSQYGKKYNTGNFNFSNQVDGPQAMDGSNHEHAIAYVQGDEYYGAKAILNVWLPRVEAYTEFSLSQLWLLGGAFSSSLNSMEAGWQVSPQLYGDTRPRLFIYWTADAYRRSGCYNLLCSGFVQTSSSVAIGASISPISRFRGGQYQIEIMVWKDPNQGDWWMVFEGHIIVGYWPSSLFTHISNSASMVQWGGEIVNARSYGRHTSTQMGSGHFANEGFGKAAFIHGLQVVDASNNLEPVDFRDLQTVAEHSNCYNAIASYDSNWGATLYYGGPGRNPSCP